MGEKTDWLRKSENHWTNRNFQDVPLLEIKENQVLIAETMPESIIKDFSNINKAQRIISLCSDSYRIHGRRREPDITDL